MLSIKDINAKISSIYGYSYIRIVSSLLYHKNIAQSRIQKPSNAEVFTKIYDRELWGSGETKSGPGSTYEYTKAMREHIENIVKEYRISTLLDAPCGDYNWMKETSLKLDAYYGVDVASNVIEQNKKQYGNDKRMFACMDLTKDQVQRVDLIVCRLCLQHLPVEDCISVIENFKSSQSEYLLATTFPETSLNRTTYRGGFTSYNLNKSPFNFPEPIEMFPDGEHELRPYMALWKLSDINDMKKRL